MPKAAAGSIRASMHVNTRYFLAGGRASEPFVKVELYCDEACSMFLWMAVMLGCWHEVKSIHYEIHESKVNITVLRNAFRASNN